MRNHLSLNPRVSDRTHKHWSQFHTGSTLSWIRRSRGVLLVVERPVRVVILVVLPHLNMRLRRPFRMSGILNGCVKLERRTVSRLRSRNPWADRGSTVTVYQGVGGSDAGGRRHSSNGFNLPRRPSHVIGHSSKVRSDRPLVNVPRWILQHCTASTCLLWLIPVAYCWCCSYTTLYVFQWGVNGHSP